MATRKGRRSAWARFRAATALAVGSLAVSASPAYAAYIDVFTLPPGPHSVAVRDTADVNSRGTKVTWRAKITCPKGERYSVTGIVPTTGRRSPCPRPTTVGITPG